MPYGRPVPAPPAYGPYPYGQGQFVQPGMLCAAADRERTIDVLKAAFGEGRLSKEEFDSRSARVLTARTYADLTAIVADLPAGPGGPVMAYPGGYYPPMMPAQPTSGLAIGSMVCGIAEILTLGFAAIPAEILTLGFAAIPAVILGHLARAQIKRTGERGGGMAIAGLILGYLGIAGWLLIILAISSHN